MPRVLMISKPVAPPWNDSSKNLVRDLASHLRRHEPTLMVQRGAAPPLSGIRHEPVYAARSAGFAPALADNARVLSHLLGGRSYALWHFFFAPNPRTSLAGRAAARLRRTPAVQTVCSAPRPELDLRRLLFADRTVVLSRHTEARVLAAGIDRERVRCIPPAVAPLEPLAAEQVQHARAALDLPSSVPLVVYPGDLEFSSGAERIVRAHALVRREHREAFLVLACRAKTDRAQGEQARLRALAAGLGLERAVSFVGETRHIHGLLAAADVVALPSETLYAKMDLPLVLIEAMLLARPVVVSEETAAAELCEGDAALAAEPSEEATAAAIVRLLHDAGERRALGARARAAALARFHPAAVASAYEALYDELL